MYRFMIECDYDEFINSGMTANDFLKMVRERERMETSRKNLLDEI